MSADAARKSACATTAVQIGWAVPARTEPEATSPETDTPARFFAEICYLLYQERLAATSSMLGFQRLFFGLNPVT
jgi:hypothetical protein